VFPPIEDEGMPIKLTKQEREAVEWLHRFAAELLEGRPVEYRRPTVERLSRMGISLEFVPHKDVGELIRGKEAHYSWKITNAPSYLRGKSARQYLPFQVRVRKSEVGHA